MLQITNGMRWGIGLWCAAATGVVASSATFGARPLTTALIAAVSCIPVAVFAGLAQLRQPKPTSSQVLYDQRDRER